MGGLVQLEGGYFMQTDIVGLSIGIAGILIGVIASYYFYRKSVRIKEPCWAIRTNNLIQGYSAQLDNLRVLYQDVNIENLTISKILFWNDGIETIDRGDIETANHLRIFSLDGVELLDAKVLTTNNQSCQFTVNLSSDKTNALLNFDYLDKKQGAVIQIVHTGTSSKDLNVAGDIKGANSIKNKFTIPIWMKLFNRFSIRPRLRRRSTALFAIVTGCFYIVLGFLQFFSTPTSSLFISQTVKSVAGKWFALIFFPLTGLLLLYMGLSLWKRLGVAPKGLESFYDDWS